MSDIKRLLNEEGVDPDSVEEKRPESARGISARDWMIANADDELIREVGKKNEAALDYIPIKFREAKELLQFHANSRNRGLIGSLRPYRGIYPSVDDKNFQEVMRALRAIAHHIIRDETVDKEILNSLWTICEKLRNELVYGQRVLLESPSISPQDITKLEEWVNAISYAVSTLLSGGTLDRAFELYRDIPISDQPPIEKRFSVKKLKLENGQLIDITDGKPVTEDDLDDIVAPPNDWSYFLDIADGLSDKSIFIKGDYRIFLLSESRDGKFLALETVNGFNWRTFPKQWISKKEALEDIIIYYREEVLGEK